MPEPTDGPPFSSDHYEPACVDPDCPVAYAYRDPHPEVPHYHARPHGPEAPDG